MKKMKNQMVKTMGKTAAGLLAVCMLASMSGCQKADNASEAGNSSAGTLGMQGVESSIMENEQTEEEDNGLTSAFADWQPKFEEQFEEIYKVPVDHYEEIKDGFYTVYAEKDGEVVPFVTLDAKSGVYEEIAEDR
jgi:lipoprotein